jgi:signal transduction histidine kinase
VRLQRTASDWQLQIHDDGQGAPSIGQGNGLNGMRERMESLGGQLHWQAVSGMPLTAQWPVRE